MLSVDCDRARSTAECRVAIEDPTIQHDIEFDCTTMSCGAQGVAVLSTENGCY